MPTDDLIKINKPLWTFDQAGEISPGNASLDAEPKLNYQGGISTLGKLIAEQLTATIHRETQVTGVARRDDQWVLTFEDDCEPCLADRVLITTPAPQAAALLEPDITIPDLSAVYPTTPSSPWR